MPINYYIFLAVALFCIGVAGVLTRRNAIIIFMCIELMLNAAILNLVASGKYDRFANAGQIGELFHLLLHGREMHESGHGLLLVRRRLLLRLSLLLSK